MSILYSLGYSRLGVAKLILLEIFILGFISTVISFVLVGALNMQVLQRGYLYDVFGKMLSIQHIAIIMFFVIMLLISSFWSLLGINKKKLKKYLEIG